MADTLKLAAAALELGAARYARHHSHPAARLALIGTGVVCAGGAGGFAVAALLIYLIPILGADLAALAVAGVLIAVAISALLLSQRLYRRRHNERPTATPQLDLQSIMTEAEGFVRENKALALSAAFVAGLLAADDLSRPR